MRDRRKAREVAVEGHHLTAMLRRDGRDHRIGGQIPERVGLVAETPQNEQMAGPGSE